MQTQILYLIEKQKNGVEKCFEFVLAGFEKSKK